MTTETTESKDLKFEHWCIVELMGHQRIAGKVTEQNLFGSALMRVDVPAVDGREGFTKFFGSSAIYAITPVQEDVARAMVSAYDTRPVEEWRLQRLLTPTTEPERELSESDEDHRNDYYGDEDDRGDDSGF